MEIREYIAELKELREGYSDEVPERVLHSDSCGSAKYKVRKAWLSCVCLLLSAGCNRGFFDAELGESCQDFLNYVSRERIADIKDRLIRSEEIERVNCLLTRVINNLGNER